MFQKGFSKILLLITLAMLALFLFVGLSWERPKGPAQPSSQEQFPADETADLSAEDLLRPSEAFGEGGATEGWETYRNEEYGFEVKYPKDWILETQDLYARVYPPEFKGEKWAHPFISINIRPNPQKFSIREFYSRSSERDWFFQSRNEYTQGQIAGKPYYRFVPHITFAGEVAVVISIDSAFIEVLDFRAAFQGGIFDAMLSTFRFLEEEEVGPQAERSNGRPPLEILKNMEYQLFECPTSSDNYSNNYYYLYDKAICRSKLKDGDYDFYEKISERPGFYEHGFNVSFSGATFADLDNDNIDDALVILRAYGGGTGSIAYLAAVIVNENGYRNVDTIAIPGEGGVIVTSINNGIITIRSPQHYEVYTYILKVSFSEEKGFEIIERKTVPQG